MSPSRSGWLAPQWARSIEAPVWISDSEQRIAWLNRHAESFLGVKAGDALGRSCHSVVSARSMLGQKFCRVDCEMQRRARQDLPLPVYRIRIAGETCKEAFLLSIPTRIMPTGRPVIVHCAIKKQSDEAPSESRSSARGAALTSREQDVLDRLASGADLRQIGLELGISYSTVRNHVQHILRKLNVHSMREAMARLLGSPRPDSRTIRGSGQDQS